MNTITATLINFGLTKNEAIVYQEAVKLEETNPFELSKLTNIPRTTVYEVITALSLKGLVELKKSDGITKQQTAIRAKNPSQLRAIIRRKRSDLVKLDNQIVHILPQLKAEFQKGEPDTDFQFFPGIEGAKKTFTDSKLDDVDLPEYLFNYKIPDDVFGREFMNQMIDQSYSIKRTHVPKEIIPLSEWTQHCIRFHYRRNPNYIKVTETRAIDNPLFNLNVRLSIKGDRVWIISVEERECWGMIIKSNTWATSLIGMFNVMWLIAQPVTDEMVKRWLVSSE